MSNSSRPRSPRNLNIPLPPRAARAWGLVLAAALALGACSSFVYEAEFAAHPGTSRPADLLGPFTGRVLDASTGHPIPNAVVMASWELVHGLGFVSPGGARTWFGKTDREGRYRVPRLTGLPSGPTRALARFRLIIYHRGFVAYRSDRVFPGDLRRSDFYQTENTARLERFTSELSHAAHVHFIGGAGPLARAYAWEVQAAVAALERRPGGPETAPRARPTKAQRLDASDLLDEDDVQEVTGFAGDFSTRRLSDVPRSASYDSKHFRAHAKDQRSDAAYRVWKLGTGAERHYTHLLAAYPNARPTDELGDRAFRSSNKDVTALVWYVKASGVVVSLTCGRNLCKTPAILVKLARLIHGRLGQLRLNAGEPLPRIGPTINPFRPVSPRAPVLK